jgi:hypothetical protein
VKVVPRVGVFAARGVVGCKAQDSEPDRNVVMVGVRVAEDRDGGRQREGEPRRTQLCTLMIQSAERLVVPAGAVGSGLKDVDAGSGEPCSESRDSGCL